MNRTPQVGKNQKVVTNYMVKRRIIAFCPIRARAGMKHIAVQTWSARGSMANRNGSRSWEGGSGCIIIVDGGCNNNGLTACACIVEFSMSSSSCVHARFR